MTNKICVQKTGIRLLQAENVVWNAVSPTITVPMSEPQHISVMKDVVLDVLRPAEGERVLDVTLGLGGHAEAFLKSIGPSGHLVGLDADQENLSYARRRLEPFGSRAQLIHVNFGDLRSLQLGPFDIIFGDLGLSSPHIDSADRGFSFRFDGPLDLRFNRETGETAADLLERVSEDDLKKIFREYGELREAGRLARLLAGKRWATTTSLKEKVEEAYGFRAKSVLPQVFQALRIAVNDELSVLTELLHAGVDLLKPGARLGILSYHSLEDRIVKHTFRELCTPLKDPVTGKVAVESAFELLTPKALVPSDLETADNPRARSAKFRVLRKKPE